MGLTSAMYTGLTGMNVNQTRIETIGNNIANVNTNAFKGSRTLFQTQFSQILSLGSAPSDTTGGTNPMQIGHGATVATTQRSTIAGSLETTGQNSDLAIEGNGFFVLRDPSGGEYYTRDGAFSLNAKNELVSADGMRVRGFGVDSAFNIVSGTLTDLVVPLGSQDIARATTNVAMDGDLSAAALPASGGSETRTQALVNGGGGAAVGTTLLSDVRSASNAGVPLFAAGDTITVTGVTKGDRTIGAAQFVVGTTGNTLDDFAAWLETTLGIQDVDGVPGDPGVTIDNGQLVIRSNAGESLGLHFDNSDVRSSNSGSPLPLQFTQAAEAVGDGVFTSFTVYDSLGTPVSVNVSFTLESTPDTGPVWRYYLETGAAGAQSIALGTGTIAFDPQGRYLRTTGNQVNIPRSGTGAETPLAFALDFSTLNGLSTEASNVVMASQDGYPPGTLITFAVGPDGVVTGTFSNGNTKPLGQVALATFANDAGLVALSDNTYAAGPNSGPAAVKAPQTLGAGSIRGGALEMSNVDITREFIGLITSSTAFQAASRVITTSNEMLDQLLLALR